jgi:hypothetical protein
MEMNSGKFIKKIYKRKQKFPQFSEKEKE